MPHLQTQAEMRFAMLLSVLDDSANTDRELLRRAGARNLRSIGSGREALRIIRASLADKAAFGINFIICAGDLPDLTVSEFMRELAVLAEHSCAVPPVMVLEQDYSALERALGQGAATAVARPCSMPALVAAVEKLNNLSGLNVNAKIPAASPEQGRAAPAPRSASTAMVAADRAGPVNKLLYSRRGLALLREGRLASAQDFLLEALRFDPLDMEAALGLARLHRANNNTERMERWTHKAGVICLQSGQPERAAAIFAKLPERWQGDHYMLEAQNLLRDEEFDLACAAFMELGAMRKKAPHELLGRACQFTEAPEYYLFEMCRALERNGCANIAQQLEKRMLGGSDSLGMQPCGFLEKFPRLQEMVTIAKFTLHVWRASEV